MSTAKKLIAPGVLLFIDLLFTAIGNWLFWLLISKITTPQQVGEATTIYSLTFLISIIVQLGMEYPLLQQSNTRQPRVLGTALAVQLILSIAALPILIYFMNIISGPGPPTQNGFAWVTSGILVFSSISFVTRYILIGIFSVKSVVLIDGIATALRFASGFVLVWLGLGAFGILVSFLLYAVTVSAGSLMILMRTRRFSFRIGGADFVKGLVNQGLINTPFKLAKAVLISLSVILLPPLGVNIADVGVFYIVLMITIVASSLSSSIALMVIPTSSAPRKDFSVASVRIGVSFTAPLVTPLLIAPKLILSMIGQYYTSAETALLILSFGIIPFSITYNAISSLNNSGEQKKILFVGSVEVLTFLGTFFLLVPNYGTIGAAISILVAFIVSCVPSIIWLGRKLIKYIINSVISIAAGYSISYVLGIIIGTQQHYIQLIVSIVATLIMIIILKNTSITELRELVKMGIRRAN
jgi:O-antigen/teichoic acid export membrane protein